MATITPIRKSNQNCRWLSCYFPVANTNLGTKKRRISYYLQRELEGHLSDVYSCRFFPSGVVVLSAGADMQLKIWSAETGKCAANLVGHRAGNKLKREIE